MKSRQIQYPHSIDPTLQKWLGWPLLLGLLCAVHADLAAQNTIHVRNCTDKILYLSSYNEWDNSMTMVYQGGSGTAIIPQINSIVAKNGGAGETGEVKCGDWNFFQSYDCCKVKFTCSGNTPCLEVTKRLQEGNYVYFSSSLIEKGDVCYKIGAEHLNALDISFEYGLQNIQLLKSNNFTLMWQADGNLVLYATINNTGAIWATGTNGRATSLAFQGDGNLVIYNNGVPVWASNTANNQHGGKGGRKLVLNDDRGLLIIDQDYNAIWKPGN